MKQVKIFLEQWGIHCFLLPIFFILHTYIQYYGLIDTFATLKILLYLEIGISLFLILTHLFTKNAQKAFIISTIVSSTFLFYGNIKELLSTYLNLSFFAKYSVLLPAIFISLSLISILINKLKETSKFTFYLNLLFIIFISIDLVKLKLVQKTFNAKNQRLSTDQSILDTQVITSKKQRTDIYYLVFDGYPNSSVLSQYNIPSMPLSTIDTFLEINKFHVITKSKSNYNSTCFSMSATLNMQYLDKLDYTVPLTPFSYSKSIADIKNSTLFDYLLKQDYKIYNLSIFDIKGDPAIYKENFLTVSAEKMLLFYTLWSCIEREILWNFKSLFPDKTPALKVNKVEKELNASKNDYNEKILDSILNIASAEKANSAKFIYAHLYLPHFPYFFDANGVKYSDADIYNHNFIYDNKKFIGYVHYTNNKIRHIIKNLLDKTSGKAIIILQSDHGYRGFAFENTKNIFKNLNAFYFPDQNYSAVYDSMSNVNTFRIILNKYFNQKVPLLPDSCIELKD